MTEPLPCQVCDSLPLPKQVALSNRIWLRLECPNCKRLGTAVPLFNDDSGAAAEEAATKQWNMLNSV